MNTGKGLVWSVGIKIFAQALDTSILDTIRAEAIFPPSRGAAFILLLPGWRGGERKPPGDDFQASSSAPQGEGEGVVLPPVCGPVSG